MVVHVWKSLVLHLQCASAVGTLLGHALLLVSLLML
jgi:hypothetical protein